MTSKKITLIVLILLITTLAIGYAEAFSTYTNKPVVQDPKDVSVSTGLTPKISINPNAPKLNQTNPVKTNNTNINSTNTNNQNNTAINNNNNQTQTSVENQSINDNDDNQTLITTTAVSTNTNSNEQTQQLNSEQAIQQRTQEQKQNNPGLTGKSISKESKSGLSFNYLFAIIFIITLIILLTIFSFLIISYKKSLDA